jgi:hypothetical protein
MDQMLYIVAQGPASHQARAKACTDGNNRRDANVVRFAPIAEYALGPLTTSSPLSAR